MNSDDDKIRKEDFSNRVENILSKLQRLQMGRQRYSHDEKLQELEIEEMMEVMKWRDRLSKFMIWFLCVQYVIIVAFLVLQGFPIWSFHLDNWIFYILISGTFVQSCFLVRIIFKYMFNYRR